MVARRPRRLHHRLLLDPHRPQLHRDDPQDARSGAHLVPAAPLRLGALRDLGHPGPGDPGNRGDDPARGPGARLPLRLLRPQSRRRPHPLPAPVLVLLAPRGLHHDPALDGRDQRDRDLLLAQARLRLRLHRRSSLAIAGIGFLVWAHHMFVSGLSVYAAMVFSALSFLVAIPSAIKTFNWTATLYRGSISWHTPMLYAFGFIGLFTIGGLTGLFLGNLGLDVHVTDTYFIVAHFHYIMVGGTIMGYLGGLHFWWPKITGRHYNEWWARVSSLHRVRRLQPDLLPPVRARLPRDAAALPRLPRGVPGPERDLVRGRARSSAWATSSRCSTSRGRCATGTPAADNPWPAPRASSGRRSRRPPAHNFERRPR